MEDMHAGYLKTTYQDKEYFGTGGNARKYIFISSTFRKELLLQKIKLEYIPVGHG